MIFRLVLFFILVLVASPVHAQPKPIGAFSPNGSPPWISFGSMGDMTSDYDIEMAYQKSIRTGFLWILQIGYHDSPLTGADVVARRTIQRFHKLLPYVVAINYGEEWYEKFYLGEFSKYGLPANNPRGVEIIHHWLGRQHFLIKQVTGKPIIWLTTIVSGERPVPPETNYVAIDAYSADGESTAWAELRLLHAEVATNLPLIVIPRWFKTTGEKQGSGWQSFSQEPTREATDMYVRTLKRPRYIAMWGFLWESRPHSDLVGLAQMPNLMNYLLQKLQE